MTTGPKVTRLVIGLLLLSVLFLVPYVFFLGSNSRRITGVRFRYAPGDPPSKMVMMFFDEPLGTPIKPEPNTVGIAFEVPLTLDDTAAIYGFARPDQVPHLRLSTAGADLTIVENGPDSWMWFYRPSKLGTVKFHVEISGPGAFQGPGFDVQTEVRNRFNMTAGQQSAAQFTAAIIGVLGALGFWGFMFGKKKKEP